jgi:hypothetical protein
MPRLTMASISDAEKAKKTRISPSPHRTGGEAIREHVSPPGLETIRDLRNNRFRCHENSCPGSALISETPFFRIPGGQLRRRRFE